MSGTQNIPGNLRAGTGAGGRPLLLATCVSPWLFGTLNGPALRLAHCAGRAVREQLMNRCEQYIIDPIAASSRAVPDFLPRGHDS